MNKSLRKLKALLLVVLFMVNIVGCDKETELTKKAVAEEYVDPNIIIECEEEAPSIPEDKTPDLALIPEEVFHDYEYIGPFDMDKELIREYLIQDYGYAEIEVLLEEVNILESTIYEKRAEDLIDMFLAIDARRWDGLMLVALYHDMEDIAMIIDQAIGLTLNSMIIEYGYALIDFYSGDYEPINNFFVKYDDYQLKALLKGLRNIPNPSSIEIELLEDIENFFYYMPQGEHIRVLERIA